MRRAAHSVAMALAMIVMAGCAGGGTATPSAPTPAPTPVPSQDGSAASGGTAYAQVGSSSLLSIDEIGVGQGGYVTLTNFTDTPVGLRGLSLCQGSQCADLPADVVVAPGKVVRIATGDGAGLQDVVMTGAALGELKATDGEVALYASPDRDDPRAMQTYLEWGTDPHDLTPVAIEAGLWMRGSFAPTSPAATRLWKADTGLWLFDE